MMEGGREGRRVVAAALILTSIKRTDRGLPTERRKSPPGNRTRFRMTRRGWVEGGRKEGGRRSAVDVEDEVENENPREDKITYQGRRQR